MSTNPRGAHSQVAVKQLDKLEINSSVDLYNTLLENCQAIFHNLKHAQSFSTAITTNNKGTIFQLPVPGHPLYKTFWSSLGPTIEAVFAYPPT